MVNPRISWNSFNSRGNQYQQQHADNENSVPNNIIENHDFLLTTLEPYWILTSDHGFVASSRLGNYLHNVAPATTGGNYAVINNRTEASHGMEQNLTERVSVGLKYTVIACVRVHVSGGVPYQGRAKVEATLRLEYNTLQDNSQPDDAYIEIGSTHEAHEWVIFTGSFILNTMPDHVIFYLEGPEPGVDLLVDSVVVLSPPPGV